MAYKQQQQSNLELARIHSQNVSQRKCVHCCLFLAQNFPVFPRYLELPVRVNVCGAALPIYIRVLRQLQAGSFAVVV